MPHCFVIVSLASPAPYIFALLSFYKVYVLCIFSYFLMVSLKIGAKGKLIILGEGGYRPSGVGDPQHQSQQLWAGRPEPSEERSTAIKMESWRELQGTRFAVRSRGSVQEVSETAARAGVS